MEPHPPFVMPSALEARHWGATYALYRVSKFGAELWEPWALRDWTSSLLAGIAIARC